MTPLFALTSLLFFVVSLHATNADVPDYVDCQTNSDCAVGQCCVIGAGRYSTPQCRSMEEEGSTCRPASAFPIEMNVGYPDGTLLELKEVHYIMCPCAHGSFCDREGGVCKKNDIKQEENELSNENNISSD